MVEGVEEVAGRRRVDAAAMVGCLLCGAPTIHSDNQKVRTTTDNNILSNRLFVVQRSSFFVGTRRQDQRIFFANWRHWRSMAMQ